MMSDTFSLLELDQIIIDESKKRLRIKSLYERASMLTDYQSKLRIYDASEVTINGYQNMIDTIIKELKELGEDV